MSEYFACLGIGIAYCSDGVRIMQDKVGLFTHDEQPFICEPSQWFLPREGETARIAGMT